ncbi:hypothetical protein [Streptomyces sp. NPDC056796]|uniref:hypothetical protein n=1 Tax=Streptomyces sp. NPDC056796 TaxID=3345947 RepID=UPI0036BCD969
MIKWEKRVNGMPLERFLAVMPGVREELEWTQFEIMVRAEENLNATKSSGSKGRSVDTSHASITRESGKIDQFVVMEDKSSSRQGGSPNSALAIELGRGAYDVTVVSPDGDTVNEYTVGAMSGLYILTDAANLPRRRKGGSKSKRHVKIRLKKKQKKRKRGD